jgi:hypothetical protein
VSTGMPGFTTAAWRDGRTVDADAGLVVRVPQTLGWLIDADVVQARLASLVADLAARVGVAPALPCTLTTTDGGDFDEPHLVVAVHGTVRFVSLLSAPGGLRHRTGLACDLAPAEAAAVAAVEHVLLGDPGILVDGAGDVGWLRSLTPDDALALDRAAVRDIAARHVSLADTSAVRRAVALAEDDDLGSRRAYVTALLNRVDLAIEIPDGTAESVCDAVREQVRSATAELLPVLGAVEMPGAVRHSAASELRAVESDTPRSRILLGGFPILTVDLDEDPEAVRAWLAQALHRAASRTWDVATARWRLDQLATAMPEAIAALRLRLSDVIIAEVLRDLSAELFMGDLGLVVDLLVEPVEPCVATLVDRLRPQLVDRHLAPMFTLHRELRVLTLDDTTEDSLRSAPTPESSAPSSTPPSVPADVAERLLRAVAAWLPGTAWQPQLAAIVVDDPAMRAPLRQLLSLQAPELLVLQAAELPGWVEVRLEGEL